jgi:hypothetical protein
VRFAAVALGAGSRAEPPVGDERAQQLYRQRLRRGWREAYEASSRPGRGPGPAIAGSWARRGGLGLDVAAQDSAARSARSREDERRALLDRASTAPGRAAASREGRRGVVFCAPSAQPATRLSLRRIQASSPGRGRPAAAGRPARLSRRRRRCFHDGSADDGTTAWPCAAPLSSARPRRPSSRRGHLRALARGRPSAQARSCTPVVSHTGVGFRSWGDVAQVVRRRVRRARERNSPGLPPARARGSDGTAAAAIEREQVRSPRRGSRFGRIAARTPPARSWSRRFSLTERRPGVDLPANAHPTGRCAVTVVRHRASTRASVRRRARAPAGDVAGHGRGPEKGGARGAHHLSGQPGSRDRLARRSPRR